MSGTRIQDVQPPGSFPERSCYVERQEPRGDVYDGLHGPPEEKALCERPIEGGGVPETTYVKMKKDG
jgi:hypothetical protein